MKKEATPFNDLLIQRNKEIHKKQDMEPER